MKRADRAFHWRQETSNSTAEFNLGVLAGPSDITQYVPPSINRLLTKSIPERTLQARTKRIKFNSSLHRSITFLAHCNTLFSLATLSVHGHAANTWAQIKQTVYNPSLTLMPWLEYEHSTVSP